MWYMKDENGLRIGDIEDLNHFISRDAVDIIVYTLKGVNMQIASNLIQNCVIDVYSIPQF